MPTHLSSQHYFKGKTEVSLLGTLLTWSALLTLLLVALYLFTPTGKFLDLKAVDFLLLTTTAQRPETETVTIAIDDNSLSQYGQWPWPRYRLAMLIDKIQHSGARTISVNILFPEPDQTSPIHWKKALHHDLGYSVDTSTVPKILLDHDAYLANTISQSNTILGYELLFTPSQSSDQACNLAPAPFEPKVGLPPAISLYQASGVLCNNSTLNRTKTPSGFFNGTPDSDGILRRLPLLIDFDGITYPSFALQTLLQAKDIENISIQNGPLGTRYIIPGKIPIDPKGNFLLSGSLQSTKSDLSAAEVLSERLDPTLLKDKIVFIGITASGLGQKYRLATTNISLVDVHKLTYQSLSAKQHRVRGDFFWVIEILLTFVLTLALNFSIARHPTLLTSAILLTVFCLLGGSSLYLSWQWGFLFSPLLPWSCLVIIFLVLTTLKYKFFQQRSASEAGNALQLLETSQETLQSILNTIPDIVFRLDSNGRIIFISSAVSKYHIDETPFLGRSIFDLVIPEDQEKAQYKLNERRTGSRATHDLELRLRFNIDSPRADNEIRYFSISAAGLYQDGKSNAGSFIGTQGIVKDITKRKQIEHQLLQAKKMEAMGNLAAGIAHDLNNILSGLVSYPDMILAETPKDDPLYKKISLIKKSGQKAAVIVQDLLTLARRNIHHLEVCNLNPIISDYLESTEHNQALQRHPQVKFKTVFLTPQANIIGSSVHISKTVMNLVNNAMEAMPDGGEIRLTTSKKEIQEQFSGYEDIPAGNYICMQVKDNGIGIPANDIPKIFEPFFSQKPASTKGTGLGMTIIWATIKDHNGFIDITSSVNKGTTISLYFPATDKQINKSEKKQPLPHATGDEETILIVDDQEEQLIIAGNMLDKLGYTVLTAKDSVETLHILKNSTVDLVILDMIMPGQLDGLETYQKILHQRPKQKAIIASGYSESERVKELQKLGAGSYIQKPYTMEELASAVRTELDRKS